MSAGLYVVFVCGVVSSVTVLLGRVMVSGRCGWGFVGVGPEGIKAAAAQFDEV